MSVTDAIVDVLGERLRQCRVEGFSPKHDDRYAQGELTRAALNYAAAASLAAVLGVAHTDEATPPFAGGGPSLRWPFPLHWWKPAASRRMLVKAAALLIAEIERIDRAAETPEHVS